MATFVANQRADGLIIATPTGRQPMRCRPADRCCTLPSRLGAGADCAAHLVQPPIVLSDATEIAIEIVGGRDASANFDMQSLASLLHGDRITVRRSEHSVRFLHPGLELLRHPAQEAPLERGRILSWTSMDSMPGRV
jgi:NAD+ kinase